nr:MAG TPA: hypothetical protein [Caudoviricetes sp.]
MKPKSLQFIFGTHSNTRPRTRSTPEYVQWILSDLNRGPSGYEPDALTN